MAKVVGAIDYELIKEVLRREILAVLLKDSAGTELSDKIKNLDVLLSTRASEDTLLGIKSKTDNLDITLSAHRDALKPIRTSATQDLANKSIAAGGTEEVSKTVSDGYSALVVTVRATYASGATAGVRVRWLFSPDGTNYDTPEDAEAQGNYYDLSFAAGQTRQATILIAAFSNSVKVQIVNKDTANAVTVNMWSWMLR